MIALTTNPVDIALAILFGIPCLIVAVCWLAIWAEERVDHISKTHDTSAGVADGLPESKTLRTDGRRQPPGALGQPPSVDRQEGKPQ